MSNVRITTRKYNGDDAYSWAVFLDGRPVLTGQSQLEARYEVKKLREQKGFK